MDDEERLQLRGIYHLPVPWFIMSNVLVGYLRMVPKLQTAIGQAIEGTTISTTICHECHEVCMLKFVFKLS